MFIAEWFGLWWLFPLLLIVLCFFMMRGCRCCLGGYRRRADRADPVVEILDEPYPRGESDPRKYRRQKRSLRQREE